MKKQIIILLLIFIYGNILVSISQVEEVFSRGIEAFEEKEYSKALEYFLIIENEGISTPDLYYNIGNCYFRINEIGKSILYFKKALRINSNHKPSFRNLKYVLTFTKDKQSEKESDIIAVAWDRIINTFSLNVSAVLTLFLFCLIIIFINLTILKYRNREKTVPLFIISVLSFIFIIFFLISFLKWTDSHKNVEAVLISSTAIGYSGPDEEFTRVFTIHEGMIFKVEKNEENWSLIKLPNGLGGWIKTAHFELVSS